MYLCLVYFSGSRQLENLPRFEMRLWSHESLDCHDSLQVLFEILLCVVSRVQTSWENVVLRGELWATLALSKQHEFGVATRPGLLVVQSATSLLATWLLVTAGYQLPNTNRKINLPGKSLLPLVSVETSYLYSREATVNSAIGKKMIPRWFHLTCSDNKSFWNLLCFWNYQF